MIAESEEEEEGGVEEKKKFRLIQCWPINCHIS
jgi:hypothetical protein